MSVQVCLSLSLTWFGCDAVVETSRGEVPLAVETQPGLRPLRRAAVCALQPQQGVGRVEELGVGHRLETKQGQAAQ